NLPWCLSATPRASRAEDASDRRHHMESKLILVPTDFSDASTHALRFAARLAERSGARIRLVYADYFVPPIDFAASAAVEYALTSDEAADEAKKLLIRTAEENLPATVTF